MLAAPASEAEVRACVQDACAICEIPAPTGEEGRRAAWVAERLRETGLDVRVDAEGSVVAGAGDVVVAAHLDTVFAGLEAIAVRREGDVLHAPGIGDNSLGVAALLFLARRRPDGLVLAATVGEEGLGNLRGARRVVADLRPRELIALEGGGAGRLVIAGIGSARFAVRATAPGGHSWGDRGSPSALHVLIEVLHRHVADPGTESVNVGSLHGGAGINVLAPSAEATLEFRDSDEDRLAAAARRLAAEPGVEVAELGRRPAGRIEPEHPLVLAALRAAASAGLARPRLDSSSTDANAALGAGIPAVTVGLCESRDAHTPEERVDVSMLGPALGALADLV
ncbi:MAG: tripeptide aminopeptidase, partial [Solirubrobacteraceae bacterium]|nr:tripeptide aminopeptidase [Solirubrobacteraceae bacterium]